MALPNNKKIQFRCGSKSQYENATKAENIFYLIEDTDSGTPKYYIHIGNNPISALVAADSYVDSGSNNAVSGSAVAAYVRNQLDRAIEVDYSEESSSNSSDEAAALVGHFRYYSDGTLKFKYADNKIFKLQPAFNVGEGLILTDTEGLGIATLSIKGGFIAAESNIEQLINSSIKIEGDLTIGNGKTLLVDTIKLSNANSEVGKTLEIQGNISTNGSITTGGSLTVGNGGTLNVEGRANFNDIESSASIIGQNLTINNTINNTNIFSTNQAVENEPPKIILVNNAHLKFGTNELYYLSPSAVKFPEILSDAITASGPISTTESISATGSISTNSTLNAANNVFIGSASGQNLSISNNEINAYNIGVASELKLNSNAGKVTVGNGGLSVLGNVDIGSNLNVDNSLTLQDLTFTTVAEGKSAGQSGTQVNGVNHRLKADNTIFLTKQDIDADNGLIKSELNNITEKYTDADTNLSDAISRNATLISTFLHIGKTTPKSESTQLWIDTNVTTNGVLKYRNGENWIAVNAVWG